MILEIESYRKDEDGILLKGNNYTIRELQQMVKSIIELSDRNFILNFCSTFEFKVIDDYCGLPDSVLDMETGFIYRPVIGEIYEAI